MTSVFSGSDLPVFPFFDFFHLQYAKRFSGFSEKKSCLRFYWVKMEKLHKYTKKIRFAETGKSFRVGTENRNAQIQA
jgi:hypothetical protein